MRRDLSGNDFYVAEEGARGVVMERGHGRLTKRNTSS